MTDRAVFATRCEALLGRDVSLIRLVTGRTPLVSGWKAPGAALEISAGDARLSVTVYTAGGCEPDGYVEIRLDDFLVDEGGYNAIKPFVAGTVPANGPEGLAEAGFEAVADPLGASPGPLRGVWIDSARCVVACEGGVFTATAGMADILRPAAPTVGLWVRPARQEASVARV
jgi:hypothetical protein